MIGKGIWFVAGASAGIYASVRARRLAQSFTVTELQGRLRSLTVGAQLLVDDVTTASREREAELRTRYGLMPQQLPELMAAGPGSTHRASSNRAGTEQAASIQQSRKREND